MSQCLSSLDNQNVIRIAITTGEPSGVGPELMYALTQQNPLDIALQARVMAAKPIDKSTLIELVLIGDKSLLQERMALYGKNFVIHDFDFNKFESTGIREDGLGHISCLHVPLNAPSIPGKMDSVNASYVLKTLDIAIEHCKSKAFGAMVTAPISKSVIAHTGISFTGHTEYLQEQCGVNEVVMMLGCSQMNVALATTHLPLDKVSEALTKEKLTNIITILHHDLKYRMGFNDPKIYVCGINPHAGEDGTLGTDEQERLIPVLEELRAKHNMNLIGPLPADTMFQNKYLKDASAILTMYHDQGLPVLKYVGFDSGYNTTLGLPFIRTSVDHGTALDLAGKGQADTGSLCSAVSLALYMAYQNQGALQ